MADVKRFEDVQRAKNAPQRRAEIAAKLRALAGEVMGLPWDPQRLVVVIVGEDDAQVRYHGHETWAQIRDVTPLVMALASSGEFAREQPTFESLQGAVTEALRLRKRNRLLHEERQAQWNRDHPWACEWCGHRNFKTERGCRQHENACYRNPGALMYRSGEYIPSFNDDGKITGYSRTDLESQNRPPEG